MKRITWWPQAWLGLVFSWGALVGWPAVTGTLDWPPLLLWFGSIAWVIGYDTLYAIQDMEDDALVGREVVRTTAWRQGCRSVSACSMPQRWSCGVRRSGQSGRTGSHWRLSRPPRCISPIRRCGPIQATVSWRCDYSARTAPAACSSSSPCWSSGFPRARARGPCKLQTPPATSPKPWSSAASPPGADCRRCPLCRRSLVSGAGAARRARGRQSFRRRADRAPPVRRPAFGDRRIVRSVRRSARRCSSSAAWQWPREAPEDPYAGLAPEGLLQRGDLPPVEGFDAARAGPRRASRTRALEAETAALAVAGVTNSSGGERRRIRHHRRARDVGRFFRRLSRHRPQLLRQA